LAIGAVQGIRSIANSISLSGGIPRSTSGKTSGYSHTTGTSSMVLDGLRGELAGPPKSGETSRLGLRDPMASGVKCGPHGGKKSKTKSWTRAGAG
jgi:hypothetical protein